MRIFKGLENIHSVIDRHELEWRKEQGESVEDLPESFSVEESVRRRFTRGAAEGSGRFSPDRFLGAANKKENKAEVISVIPEKDGKPHSWLYHEVIKAVNDAAGNDKNVKVIAVFIPVIQNGKEFEDLPVNETVTLPPVYVEDVDVEKILEENAKENSGLQQENENNENENPLPSETNGDFDLIPQGPDHPDEELAEAFNTMEEKLDEALEEQHEETEPEPELTLEQEQPAELEVEDNVDTQAEPLNFEEMPVIKEEEDTETPVEDLIEEITPENVEEDTEIFPAEDPQEHEKQEQEAENVDETPDKIPAPLDEFTDEEVYDEQEAHLSSLSNDEEQNEQEDEEEKNLMLNVE